MAEENVETRFAVHEAVCAQRYQAIENRLDEGSKRMTRIEHLLYITIAAVFLGPGVAAIFLKRFLGM